ncbi:MAG: DUF4338 domain-containing protein [Desulfovibrio sp.]|nr:DUF4338 domain-containing protein [Desulfovibrio sp.]
MAQLRRKRPSALRHLPRLVGPPATVRPPAEALKWLGWSDSERRDSLDNVLATMNRLLIREKAHRCRNLPSKVVSMLLAAVRRDWPAVYGFEIFLVETFVDPADFAGTTYKASNWIEIGRTGLVRQGEKGGRGREDAVRLSARSRLPQAPGTFRAGGQVGSPVGAEGTPRPL